MLKRLILAGVTTVFFATTAYAGQCPGDMAKIDAALPAKMSSLSADNLSKVKSLRTKGEGEHKAGNHGAAVNTLGEAMQLLGIK